MAVKKQLVSSISLSLKSHTAWDGASFSTSSGSSATGSISSYSSTILQLVSGNYNYNLFMHRPMQIKNRQKRILSSLLECVVRALKGSGIGRIPGVPQLYTRIFQSLGLRMRVKVKGWEFNVAASPNALLYFSGRYEPNVTNLYYKLLKRGTKVADVGASTGYYTLLASRAVGTTGAVFSFEPETNRFNELLDNIRINKCNNVKPLKISISNRNGKSEFEHRTALGSGCLVKTRALDSFEIDFDLVKMDIEGGELDALKGMKKLLAKGEVKIICEIHPDSLIFLGYDVTDIEDILNKYGYEIYEITGEGLIPKNSLTKERKHYLFTKE